MFLGLIIALFIILADQFSKYFIFHEVLEDKAMIIYTSYFSLVRAWNTGVSFSMFNNLGISGVYILSGVSLVIVGMLAYWLYKEKDRMLQVALGFVIGGALGNVIDRIRVGAVFDFLDFSLGTYHWPAFNVADSFICVGAFLIICHGLFQKKQVA